jgi:hypothetical protein
MSGKQNAKFLVPKKKCKIRLGNKMQNLLLQKRFCRAKRRISNATKANRTKKNWEEKCKIPKLNFESKKLNLQFHKKLWATKCKIHYSRKGGEEKYTIPNFKIKMQNAKKALGSKMQN